MQLWFRLILYFLKLPFQQKLTDMLSKSVVRLRVLPGDIDMNLHLTNSRYLAMMDYGRVDHMSRTKLGKAIFRNKWTPLANHATVRFRRELPFWEPFRLESKIVYWTEEASVMEQRFIFTKGPKKDIVAATGLVRISMYDRAQKAFVPTATVLSETDTPYRAPMLQPHIEAFLKEEKAIQAYERKSAGIAPVDTLEIPAAENDLSTAETRKHG
ncbi:thioesterase family protein [Pseudovibrio sp. Tun.PSC04-5.I4]|uniref:thioesterase family protein n=1 Tax=Pseudovibrio sp. Tun.PSC04-5.I4 TaxID=1798213 RepID=UPI0008866805|nr:thioesterase family protein [Pseudovibrio sp. Tun.PSC04-5.I4]SDR35563.1 Acyl-CoA thioesterase FadM [Pseudovibrio sp. Tun.PSC04-5.I4]